MKKLTLAFLAVATCMAACDKNDSPIKTKTTDFRDNYTGNFSIKDSSAFIYSVTGGYIFDDSIYHFTATVTYKITDSVTDQRDSLYMKKKLPALQISYNKSGYTAYLYMGIDDLGNLYPNFKVDKFSSFMSHDSISFYFVSIDSTSTVSEKWTGHKIP